MKKLIGVGIVTGLAVAAILGTITIVSPADVAESVTKLNLEVKSERVAPNFVDFNGGVYAGTESDLKLEPGLSTPRNWVDFHGFYAGNEPELKVAKANAIENMVDFNGGIYADEMPDDELNVINEYTVPNFVDWTGGYYAEELP